MTNADSDLILDRLQALHPKAIDLSLGRLERLLDALDHPERRLAPVVHIAGTNGKGSTLAMLDSMLRADQRRVQRYISPHLVRFAERILLDGEPIDEPAFADVLDRAERANRGESITFFEITTAAAFLAFAERHADILLLETGLGGRLDATNVIDRPLLTLITPVSYDHQAFLGDRLEQIAGEKAGILKPGVPCALGPQRSEALSAIQARADAIGAPLLLHGRDWHADHVSDRLVVRFRDEDLDLPLPALRGEHQIENAGLAVVAALMLGKLSPSREAIAEGLEKARWPGRLERLIRGPLHDLLPERSALWLDGGHNPAAGEALAAFIDTADPRPLHLVVGMINTKDSQGFLAPMAPFAETLHAVPVPDEQASRDPSEVVQEAHDLGLAAVVSDDVPTALSSIAEQSSSPVRVLICGSLYLAGHVLRANS
ncbi:MAG: folylpolyglutamate synthase/dihydrofolate synthase family protein [Pseudomonadota bacterium]